MVQLHDPSFLQVPAFLHVSASHANSGHVPSIFNANSPGQGVAVGVGIPLNIYRNYYQLCIEYSHIWAPTLPNMLDLWYAVHTIILEYFNIKE